jgi:hypothetical protein
MRCRLYKIENEWTQRGEERRGLNEEIKERERGEPTIG